MLTEKQFTEAITFVKDFKDALWCIEQINERRAAVEHYEDFGSLILSSLKAGHIKLTDAGVVKGDGYSSFPLLSIMKYSNELLKKYSFTTAATKEELLQKFDKATKDLV